MEKSCFEKLSVPQVRKRLSAYYETPKFHYRCQNSLPTVLFLNQISPI